jgi:haloacetate dehalogenase
VGIPGVRSDRRRVGEVEIAFAIAGEGPPLLLLHGYPQTRLMWRHVAPALARRFTVVAADLRGYGKSSKPPGDPAHATYSKRAMAADQVGLMRALGHERFAVVGHDRGARVAHRMALDHPDAVARLGVIDIAPTRHLFEGVDQAFATAYYHWFFLIQPDGLPERMIGADPEWFLRETVRRWSAVENAIDEAALAAYVAAFADPATIHASCEDYRAAASIDLEHDRADAGRRVACPTLALWGARGAMARLYDLAEVWRGYAEELTVATADCGHFVPEEDPAGTLAALEPFLDPWAAA